LEFPILNKYPAVDKLPLHLQDEQEILFDPQNAEAALARGIPQTKLTAFFQLNQESDEAKDMLYSDIYRHYIWSNNKWVKRQRNTKRSNDSEGHSEKIGRIPVINLNPKQSELFFLRTLLYHVPGPKSFEDIKTVDGVLHETNQAACIAMGLYEDDQELDKALEEAATIKFGKALRNVFVSILVFCMPANAKAFLERHQKNLSEDLMRRDKTLEPTVGHINEVLLFIEEGISRHNLQMSEVFLPKPDISLIPQHVPRVIREEMDYDQEVLVETMETNLPLLNEAQQIVYDKIMQSVENGDGKLFSLDAPGGTGKTFTLTTILAGVRLQEKVAFAMATSGIAATLLPNGQTVHSKMKVPIELKENSMCNIKGTSALATLVRQCSLMVIDEVTMAHKDVFATLDRTLRDIRSNERPFGGITMLFSGDWRQILPVVIKGGKAEILKATLKASPLWQQVSH
jgi:ATP-dependent DNA helicase PIF1